MSCIEIYPGYNVPLKRYKNFITKLEQMMSTINPDEHPKQLIICHSIGIIDYLLQHPQLQQNKLIVSIDGTDLHLEDPQQMKDDNYDKWKQWKALEKSEDFKLPNIILFYPKNKIRNDLKADEKNYISPYYKYVFLYPEKGGHYPFYDKDSQNIIIQKIRELL
jgi:hypothetical protein